MPRAYSRMVGLWAIFTLMTGCWISPDVSLWQSRADLDMASDGPPKDGPAVDHLDSSSDLAPDVKPTPGPLTCTQPQKVGSSPPTNTYETALRVDGTELLSKSSGSWKVTKRPAVDQPFDTWSSSSLLTGSSQDPTFFSKGVELAVVARSPGSGLPRFLELCTLEPLSCTQLPVQFKVDTTTVTDDMDGPSVAVLTDGTVVMAHNIDIGGTEIYLARAIDSNDLSKGFETEPVTAINQSGVKEDDPALSPDGLVLMYGAPGNASDAEVWVSERASTSAAFPKARPLSDVNSTDDDSSPYLAHLPPSRGKTRYELFFSSKRDGGSHEVYRSECSR